MNTLKAEIARAAKRQATLQDKRQVELNCEKGGKFRFVAWGLELDTKIFLTKQTDGDKT